MWENGNTTDNTEGDLVRDFVPVKDAEPVGRAVPGVENIGLVVARGFPKESPPAFVTNAITEHRYWTSSGMQSVDYVFPLYLYDDNLGEVRKTPNLNPEIVAKIAAAINPVNPVNPVKETPSPEDIFDYIYAVLHTPEYRSRYKEFLKVDFPRIPYPRDAATFRKLVEIGAALRNMATDIQRTSRSSQ